MLAEKTMQVSPVPPSERMIVLDVLRGFALFGILAVNWTLDWQNNSQPWDVSGFANQMTAWIVWIAAASKFMTIFSFLFAVGFVIQMEHLRARTANAFSIYSRRLIVLFLIGAANFIFGPADVVYVYAMLGFVLLLIEKHPPAPILPALAVTVMLLLWTYDVWTGREMTEILVEPEATIASQVEADDMENLWKEWERVRISGSFGEVTVVRAQLFWKWSLRRWQWFAGTLVAFLLGLYAGRKRIFYHIEQNLPFIRRVTRWSLVAGILFLVLSAGSYNFTELSYLTRKVMELLWQFSILSVGLFYIGGITLLLQDPEWVRRLQPLAKVGRMALTNFLLHSVAFVPLFLGYGLGLRGKIGAFGCLMLAVLFFLLQVAFSSWWLKRYQFGPAEWLWRTLTYGKLPPMNRASKV